MGDHIVHRASTSSRATETTVTNQEIVQTNVLTVADVKPSEPATPVKAEVKEEEEEEKEEVKEPQVTADDLVAVYKHDTVADGTVFQPNQIFEQTWVLRNEGKIAWPANCSVKFVGGDYMGQVEHDHPQGVDVLASASESTVCVAPLAPGEEFPFTVVLRTPGRDGKAISYWRLTTPEGIKFGHRLWCDVNVRSPKKVEEPKAAIKEEPKPASDAASVKTQESQMIFPKLDKESPVSSIHRETKPEPPVTREEDYEDCADDDAWAEDESDAGFLTDEEYDILDASDEEYLEEQSKKVLKK
jgi:next-to-BRCA1 protein 1